VDESTIPTGWDLSSINCSVAGHASSGVTPVIDLAAGTVTFDIDANSDVLDCTYTNRARGRIIVEKITDDGQGTFGFTSNTLTPASFNLTTTAAGTGGKDSTTFADLNPGTYDVAETVPTGWNLVSQTCDDGSAVSAISVSAGETVTCTFHDARERGAIEITKLRKHAAGGSGDQPHAGVTFTITGGSLPAGGTTVVTGANGKICLGNLVVSSLVGNYTVTETVPAGYHAEDGPATVTVHEGTCASNPDGVTFHNTPLTDITLSVNSQVDGGTASTIDCGQPNAPTSTGANGDGSVTRLDLEPGTYICTVVVDP
jgi:uncharacterized surface anchored protein